MTAQTPGLWYITKDYFVPKSRTRLESNANGGKPLDCEAIHLGYEGRGGERCLDLRRGEKQIMMEGEQRLTGTWRGASPTQMSSNMSAHHLVSFCGVLFPFLVISLQKKSLFLEKLISRMMALKHSDGKTWFSPE